MNRVGRNTVSAFERIQEFLRQHPMSDAPALLGAQATELDTVLAQLSASIVDQESGTRFMRVHTESQRTLRAQLYAQHMRPISRVAREIFGASGMDRAFRLPKTIKVNQPLVTAAEAMAQAAENERDAFLQHGLPQDFIDQLRAAMAALQQAMNSNTESQRRRVTATATTKDLIARGRKAVRLLDAILVPRFSADPELLAASRSASRIRPSASPTPVANAAAPVTNPSAVPSVSAEKAA